MRSPPFTITTRRKRRNHRATTQQYAKLVKDLNTMNKPGLARPTADMFGRGNSSWAKNFVLSLVQGEPCELPEGHNNADDTSSRAAVYNAGKAENRRVATLEFNGKLWACYKGPYKATDATDDD